jgi:hypothetical protein
VRIANSEVRDVVLPLTPNITLFRFLSVAKKADCKVDCDFARDEMLAPYFIGLEPASPSASPIPERTVIKPSGFRIEGIEQGEYVLTGSDLFQTTYIKEARINHKDILGKPFHIPFSPPDFLEIVIGTTLGDLAGTVVDEARRFMYGARLALIPDQRLLRDRYRVTDSRDGGGFLFEGVPPGSYKIFAFEELATYEYFDLKLIERFEKFGTPVTIAERQTAQVEVKVIRR